MMDEMQAALKLCGCLGWLSPKEVCRLQSSCKALLQIAVSWNNYPGDIHIDMLDASRVAWLQKNIRTIKQLVLADVEDHHPGPLAPAAALLTSLVLNSSSTGSAGLQHAAFLMHLQQLATLSIDAPLLATIPALPNSLRHLDLTGCSTLQQLPDALPPCMTSLNCDDCRGLLRLPSQLPGGLVELKIGFCSSMTELPELPKSITYLDFSRCHKLEVMPVLPDELLYLDMLACTRLAEVTSLPALPPSLTYLDMSCYPSWQIPEGALPAHLEVLKLHFWDTLRALPQLPTSLKRLSCGYCGLESLDGLPAGLTYLQVSHNVGLLALPDALPPNLEVLKIEGCDLSILPEMLPQSLKVFKARSVQIPILPNVPTSLQTLDLAGNKQLLSVPDLSIATGLQELRLRGSPAIDDLPHGPPNLHLLQHLTQLVLTDCEVLVQLPDLPLGLKRLLVRSCPNLEILPDLPPGLVDLVIGECEQIISLPPDLPESLQELSVDRSPIQQVSMLPAGLRRLCIRTCEELELLPDVLPVHLTDLECSGSWEILELPPVPTGLKRLTCADSIRLLRLPDLPQHLTELNCKGCQHLEVLPPLQCNLERLNCSGCEALSVIPPLPRSLKYFDCSMCISLRRLPDITGTCMIDLVCGGCKELVIGIQQFRTLPPTLQLLDVSGLEKSSMWNL